MATGRPAIEALALAEPPPGRRIAVLSDVHIGDNSPTCWYQAAIHEPYLTAALNWIARDEGITDVVLLGDTFDFWTYPPAVRPPDMARIIAANHGLLGVNGPLARLVRSRPYRVHLVTGNHDLTLTRSDMAVLNAKLGGDVRRGQAISLHPRPVLVFGRDDLAGPRTGLSHGHEWCMFNAPDPASRWDGLPVGHFVSRAIAYQVSRVLQRMPKGSTAAHLAGSGNPNGADLGTALRTWNPKDDLAGWLLRYICRSTGMPLDERVVMAHGPATSCAEAITVFRGLYGRWQQRLGAVAMRAAAVESEPEGRNLAWFAQRLALQQDADLVVLGHTHTPMGGLAVAPVQYVNGGYECVAIPDRATRAFTFTVVDLERASAEVMAVHAAGGAFQVARAHPPVWPSAIPPRFHDFSCYVRVENRRDRPLRLVDARASDGRWVVPPPAEIPARRRAAFWLQDVLGPAGSGGRVAYTDGTGRLDLAFSCPTMSPNTTSASVSGAGMATAFRTRSGSGGWVDGDVERTGHPVQVQVVVDRVRAGVQAAAPRRPAPATTEFPQVVAMRQIMATMPRGRGEVLTLAHLYASSGPPLLDTETETSGGVTRLRHPPEHHAGAQVHSVTVPGGPTHRYIWILPNPLAPVSTPGGVVFLPAYPAEPLTVVTFNVERLDRRYKRSCENAHHAEMQLTSFVEHQPGDWRGRLAKLAVHNRSRSGPDLGPSPCTGCCADLAHFLDQLNRRRVALLEGTISWERLYTGRPDCPHPTDAACIKRLRDSHWEPQGAMPPGARHEVPEPELVPA